jgi:hypothetical protein
MCRDARHRAGFFFHPRFLSMWISCVYIANKTRNLLWKNAANTINSVTHCMCGKMNREGFLLWSCLQGTGGTVLSPWYSDLLMMTSKSRSTFLAAATCFGVSSSSVTIWVCKCVNVMHVRVCTSVFVNVCMCVHVPVFTQSPCSSGSTPSHTTTLLTYVGPASWERMPACQQTHVHIASRTRCEQLHVHGGIPIRRWRAWRMSIKSLSAQYWDSHNDWPRSARVIYSSARVNNFGNLSISSW